MTNIVTRFFVVTIATTLFAFAQKEPKALARWKRKRRLGLLSDRVDNAETPH